MLGISFIFQISNYRRYGLLISRVGTCRLANIGLSQADNLQVTQEVKMANTLTVLGGIESGAAGVHSSGPVTGTNLFGTQSVLNQTGKTASISSTPLTSIAGATPPAGQYELSGYLNSTGSCSNVTAGSVAVTMTYTDTGATRTGQTIPLDVLGATSLAGSMAFTTSGTNGATFNYNFWSTGSVNIATTYVACTTGTGTYDIHAALTRKQ